MLHLQDLSNNLYSNPNQSNFSHVFSVPLTFILTLSFQLFLALPIGLLPIGSAVNIFRVPLNLHVLAKCHTHFNHIDFIILTTFPVYLTGQ